MISSFLDLSGDYPSRSSSWIWIISSRGVAWRCSRQDTSEILLTSSAWARCVSSFLVIQFPMWRHCQLLWFLKRSHSTCLHGKWRSSHVRVLVADIASRNFLLDLDLNIKFCDFSEASLLPLDDNGYTTRIDIGFLGAVYLWSCNWREVWNRSLQRQRSHWWSSKVATERIPSQHWECLAWFNHWRLLGWWRISKCS